MWQANPDGAGVVVMTPSYADMYKGIMSVDELWDLLEKLQEAHLIIHFRYATHGSKNQEMTHPFIVASNPEQALALNARTSEPMLVHNGILTYYGNDTVSDTADFVINALSKLSSEEEMVKLLQSIGSKHVLISKGLFWKIGGFEKHRGLWVSNTYFDSNRYFHGNNLHKGKIWTSGKGWHNDDSVFTVKTDSNEKRGDSLAVTKKTEESLDEKAFKLISGGNGYSGTEVS